MKKALTEKECLAVVEFLVSVNEDPTDQEAQQIIHDIYSTVHSYRKEHSCYHVHNDWRKKGLLLLKSAKKQKFI